MRGGGFSTKVLSVVLSLSLSVGFLSVSSIAAFADSIQSLTNFDSSENQYIDIESTSSAQGSASLQAIIKGKVLSQADCGGVMATIAETQNQVVNADGSTENEIVCYFAPKEGNSGEITTVEAFTSSAMYCREKVHRIISKGVIKLSLVWSEIEPGRGYYSDEEQYLGLAMFSDMAKLRDISGLKSWDITGTANLYAFFRNCTSLTDLTPLKNWNTSNVTTMTEIFKGCSSLTNLNGLQNWNISNVTELIYTFSGCTNLSDISSLSGWNTSKVSWLDGTFQECSSIQNIDELGSWDTSSIESVSYLFNGCEKLTSISALSNWALKNVSISYLFEGCSKLQDISCLSTWKFDNCPNMSGTFRDCVTLKDATVIGTWGLSGSPRSTGLEGTFHGCVSLEKVDLRFLDNAEMVQSYTHMSYPALFHAFLGQEEPECFNIRLCVLPSSAEKFKSAASRSSLKIENLWEREHKAYQFKLEDGTLIDSTDDLLSVWDTKNLAHTTIEIVEKAPEYIDIDDPSLDDDSSAQQVKINVSNSSGSIKVNGQEVGSDNTVDVDTSKDMTLSWTPTVKSSTNFSFVSSVKVNGVEQASATNIDKSAWKTTNSEYKRRMGQTAKMVTFENVQKTSQTITVKASQLASLSSADTSATVESIDVEFQEVVPVYRLYNMITSEHLFTTDKAEYDSWVAKCKSDKDYWIGEGIDWFAPKTYSSSTSAKVYRLYNAALGAMGRSSHYYTSDTSEINDLVKNHGWKKETQFDGGYVFLSDKTSTATPIWTCYNEALGSAHHYTSDKTEWTGLSKHGWDLEKTKNGTKGVFAAVMSAK